MKPFFSIIIPTYNRATLIAKAIDSVIAQTFLDWELLIIDDGSTDNTSEVVEAYKDSRIKYIFQKNAERSAARNNGINKATGNYICFLDSDDYYLPQRLQLLFTELEKQKFPVSTFYTGLVLELNGLRTNRLEEKKSKNIFNQIALSVIHSQQTCIHTTILQQIHYDTAFHIAEDMELWLRIADKYSFIYLENQHTVVVVDHEDRSVNVKRYNSYVHQMRVLKKIFSANHPGHQISKGIQKELISYCYFGMAKYFIYTGSRINAAKNLLLAIITDSTNKQNKYRLNIIIHLLVPDNSAAQMLEV